MFIEFRPNVSVQGTDCQCTKCPIETTISISRDAPEVTLKARARTIQKPMRKPGNKLKQEQQNGRVPFQNIKKGNLRVKCMSMKDLTRTWQKLPQTDDIIL